MKVFHVRFLLAVALLTLLICSSLSAELRKVEMTVGGLDCDSCALSVDRVVKRIRGVDTAAFDAKTNLVTVTFKPENKVRLSAIRDAVKGVGYTPGETRITARGSLAATGANGEWQFELSGVDGAFKADVPEALRKSAGSDVIVEGTIQEKSPDLLQVRSVKKPE